MELWPPADLGFAGDAFSAHAVEKVVRDDDGVAIDIGAVIAHDFYMKAAFVTVEYVVLDPKITSCKYRPWSQPLILLFAT